jgi:hypothetical protein
MMPTRACRPVVWSIGDKGTAHRPAAFFSSHTHDSAESLQDDVVAKIVFKRTRAAEAGNAAIDKVVALALEAFKVDAESFSYAGAIAFDNDICGPRELSSDLFAGFRLEVDCQAALVAIRTQEHGTSLATEWRPTTSVIADDARLYLNNVGAEVSKILRAKWARQDLGEV